MTVKLSEQARAALINASAARQGATLPSTTPGPVLLELRNAGLIGAYGGLTRTGTIARDRAVTEKLEKLL